MEFFEAGRQQVTMTFDGGDVIKATAHIRVI